MFFFKLVELLHEEAEVNNVKNLMKHSTKHILDSFIHHEDRLAQIYNSEIQKRKKNYKRLHLPNLIELDIVTSDQLIEMAKLAEEKLVEEETYNSTDVIFDAILPEWAVAQFCEEFNLSQTQDIELIKKQNQSIIDKFN